MCFSLKQIDTLSNVVNVLRIIIHKTNEIPEIICKITIVIIIIGIGGGFSKDKWRLKIPFKWMY